jgi:uroporphyrinogen decarboxylase
MTMMTSRERVLSAVRHRTPDRVPRDILLEPQVAVQLAAYLGTKDLHAALLNDLVYVHPSPTRIGNDFSQYFTASGVTWDEWGRGRIWDSQRHYAEYLYPLEKAQTVDEILAYPWPDLYDPNRYADMTDRVAAWHKQGYAVIGDVSETTFEIAWQLRSMGQLFEDMMQDDEKAAVLLDHITDRNTYAARQMVRAGIDILYTGDDVAMQTGLMMSRNLWKRWLGPRLERVIQAAREIREDIPVKYHSDGKINDLIPDLITAGVTILNPVQPECIDIRWVKSTFGDQLAFYGGLGVQSVLPFGKSDEVRSHVRETIKILGAGGGLVIGPSHVIERDTPIENILAMQDAIDQYGRFDLPTGSESFYFPQPLGFSLQLSKPIEKLSFVRKIELCSLGSAIFPTWNVPAAAAGETPLNFKRPAPPVRPRSWHGTIWIQPGQTLSGLPSLPALERLACQACGAGTLFCQFSTRARSSPSVRAALPPWPCRTWARIWAWRISS